MNPSSTLVCCRPGFEPDLAAEISARAPACKPQPTTGGVLCTGPMPDHPFIFERQRLPDLWWIPRTDMRPIPATLASLCAQKITALGGLWTIHAWDTQQGEEVQPACNIQGFADTLQRMINKADPALSRRFVEPRRLERRTDGTALQLALSGERIAASIAPMSALSARQPGGVLRMPFDSRAPSRSYLKLEEALARLGEEPTPGQTAVDLGAAPGGWTFALAKRGVHVTAIDNGPLRIPDIESLPGRITHLREDGVNWTPPDTSLPLDWLVADMLIPPGQAIGLLRRWTDARWARRLIVNIKIPQVQAWPPLAPLLETLARIPNATFSLRHLYHDRREITVIGALG